MIAGIDNKNGLCSLPLLKNKEGASVDSLQDNPVLSDVSSVDDSLFTNTAFSEVSISGDAIYTLQSESSDIDGEESVHSVETDEDETFNEDIPATEKIEGENNASSDSLTKTETLSVLDSELTAIEKIKVDHLIQVDAEVKRHERSHMNVGGQYAGAAKYTYTKGPDGERYAISGSVNIDTSEVKDNPRATIEKMQIVRRAALAPSDPSNEDRQVANKALVVETKARRELKEEDTSSKDNALLLYSRMIMLYGKNNIRDFSAFSLVAQDF